jgi:predicted metal-binding membrane protein
MGIVHGVFCLGCCWFLMALLFYGGVMNLIWIIGLALLVLAEKLMPAGVAFGRVTGLLLITWQTGHPLAGRSSRHGRSREINFFIGLCTSFP